MTVQRAAAARQHEEYLLLECWKDNCYDAQYEISSSIRSDSRGGGRLYGRSSTAIDLR